MPLFSSLQHVKAGLPSHSVRRREDSSRLVHLWEERGVNSLLVKLLFLELCGMVFYFMCWGRDLVTEKPKVRGDIIVSVTGTQ